MIIVINLRSVAPSQSLLRSPLLAPSPSLSPSAPGSPADSSLAARQEAWQPRSAGRGKPFPSPAYGQVAQKQLLQHKAWYLCQKARSKFRFKQHQGACCVHCFIHIWHFVPWSRRGLVFLLLSRSNLQTSFLFRSCQPTLDNNFCLSAEWIFILQLSPFRCGLVF